MNGSVAASIARTLTVDASTAQVIEGLHLDGVEPILLKGPTLAEWLYRDAIREYGDSDLLVAPTARVRAEAHLRGRGFELFDAPAVRPGLAPPPAQTWMRGWEQVDLHSSFWGVRADPVHLWATLRGRALPWSLAGAQVLALDEPGRVVLVVLHALHHGREPKPREDLRRAVAHADRATWRAALEVATELGCTDAFGVALAQAPGGDRLRVELGLGPPRGLVATVSAAGLPLSDGFERMARSSGVRRRGHVLAAEILPSAEFMRWRYRLARRGRKGLLAAYGIRWLGFLTTGARLATAVLRRRAAAADARSPSAAAGP